MTTLLLIRHGNNDSIGKYLPGLAPGLSLNESGREQARQIAQALGDVGVQRVVASPLERARETAAPLAQVCGLPVEVHPGLIEMDTGDWTGRKFEELRQDPAWEHLRRNPETTGYPGGETYFQAQERIWAALEQIQRQNESRITAIFSHSDCIRLALAKALEIPLRHFPRLVVDTASLNVLVFHREHLFVEGQNLRLPYSWKPRAN